VRALDPRLPTACLVVATTLVACAQVVGIDDWAGDPTQSGPSSGAGPGTGGATVGPGAPASQQGAGGTAGSSSTGGTTTGPTVSAGGGSPAASSEAASTADSVATVAASSADASTAAASTSAASTAAASSSSTGAPGCDPAACLLAYPDDGCKKGECIANGCTDSLYNEGMMCGPIWGGSGICTNGLCKCQSPSNCTMLGCLTGTVPCCKMGSCACVPLSPGCN
jgi:hypothetical protein